MDEQKRYFTMDYATRLEPDIPGSDMSDLQNLNEANVPKSYYFQDNHNSSQTSSTAGSSLRSPVLFTNFSENAECLRLTPVNINNLTSPVRAPKDLAAGKKEEAASYTAYKENFNLITRKLA